MRRIFPTPPPKEFDPVILELETFEEVIALRWFAHTIKSSAGMEALSLVYGGLSKHRSPESMARYADDLITALAG